MTKNVNFYIAYDLAVWPKVPLKNVTLKNCFFGMTNIVKNSEKYKWVYNISGYEIAFDRRNWWSFGNSTARNFIIFGVDNSSLSLIDNLKNIFLIFGLGQTYGINGSFGKPEKKFSINFTIANRKFCLSLNYDGDNSYLLVNGKEIIKFKIDNKNVNFPTRFCLGSIYDGFSATESKEVSLNKMVYGFSVDYSSIKQSNTLNIDKYLITKNNIK